MKHVIIVMTMWDAFKTSARVGDDRVQELERDYFSDALRHGARTAHHNNTPESAVGILEQLVGAGAEPNALRIQREMVDDRVEVVYTGAGRELMEQLGAEAMRLEKDAREKEHEEQRLEDELRPAHEGLGQTTTELREGIRRIRAELEQVRREQDSLRRALDDALQAQIRALMAQILPTTHNATQEHAPVGNMLCCWTVYADGKSCAHRTNVTKVHSTTKVLAMTPESLLSSTFRHRMQTLSHGTRTDLQNRCRQPLLHHRPSANPLSTRRRQTAFPPLQDRSPQDSQIVTTL